MIIGRFAKIEMILFIVLLIFSGERMNDLSMHSTDILNSFNNLVGRV